MNQETRAEKQTSATQEEKMNNFPKEAAPRGPGFVRIIGRNKWQTTVHPITSIPGWTQHLHWLTSTPLGHLAGNKRPLQQP